MRSIRAAGTIQQQRGLSNASLLCHKFYSGGSACLVSDSIDLVIIGAGTESVDGERVCWDSGTYNIM